jgi:hypothetical protein
MRRRRLENQAHQVEVRHSRIRSIKALLEFGVRKLGLDFAGSFQKADTRAEFANWLYVSHAYKIESAIKRRPGATRFKFSWDRRYLKRSAAAYRGLGFDTYLFSAEGHGGGKCPITPALLASSPARRGYVVLHEGWHSTLHKKRVRLPYPIEEATGRAIGCFGIIEFARESNDTGLLAQALAQERDWSLFAGFINRWHRRLSKLYAGKSSRMALRKRELLEEAGAEAAKLRKKMKTHWERKELEAKLNNAFFLRYHDYTCYYSAAARVVKASCSLKKAAESFKKLQNEKIQSRR